MARECVGYCGVDSGLIFIGDPCYIRKNPQLYCGGQTVLDKPDLDNPYFTHISHKPDAKGIKLPDRWSEVCDTIYPKKGGDILPHPLYDGVMTHTRNGDGEYPVYVTKDKEGRVKKLEIVF